MIPGFISTVELTATYIVGSVLLLSGVSKLFGRADLIEVIKSYRIAPSWAIRPLMVALIVCELGIGLALCCQITPFVSALAAASLFSAFTIAIVINLLRGNRNIACGCFGALSNRTTLSWSLVLRNIALIFASLGPIVGEMLRGPGIRVPATGRVVSVILALATGLFVALISSLSRLLRLSSEVGREAEVPN